MIEREVSNHTNVSTKEVTTHFRSKNGFSWELCYDSDVDDSLATGWTVKRLTILSTYITEILEPK